MTMGGEMMNSAKGYHFVREMEEEEDEVGSVVLGCFAIGFGVGAGVLAISQ